MTEESKGLLARLAKIEGQVKGIAKMIEQDRDCVDILTQISAVNGSLMSVAKIVMQHHVEHCVVNGIKYGNEEDTVKQLKIALEQYLKIK
jgi:DNA-binding FrmR family transcriptional regulator